MRKSPLDQGFSKATKKNNLSSPTTETMGSNKNSFDEATSASDDAVDILNLVRSESENDRLPETNFQASRSSDQKTRHKTDNGITPGAQRIAPFANDNEDNSETAGSQQDNVTENNLEGSGGTSPPMCIAELVQERGAEEDIGNMLEKAREEGRKEVTESAVAPLETKIVDEIAEQRTKRCVIAVIVVVVASMIAVGVAIAEGLAQRRAGRTSKPSQTPTVSPSEQPSQQPIPSLVQQLMMYLDTEMEPLSYPATDTSPTGDKALAWLADEDPLVPSILRETNFERLRQRFALLSFAFGNPSYPFEFSEMREHECLWPYVTCSNTTNRAISIHTEGNPLSGSLSESFGLLTELRQISFYAGELQGSLPRSLSQLTLLEEITMDVGGFTGPFPWSSLANMSNLVMLGIGDNAFSGNLPTSVVLPKLEKFYLYRNAFTGTLPTEIASWTSLKTFSVTSNLLSGTIPSEYAAWTNLEAFYVGENLNLNGSLPTELGGWSQLDIFDVSSTKISGEIPATYANWANLTLGLLHNSQLNGAMPLCTLGKTFGMLIADCTKVSCPCCSDCCPVSVGDVPQYGFCDF